MNSTGLDKNIADVSVSPTAEAAAIDQDISDAGERLTAGLEELGRRVETVKDTANIAQFIRDRPLASIAVAFAAGALIGIRRPGDKALQTGIEALVGGLILQTAKAAGNAWVAHQINNLPSGQRTRR